MNVSAGDSIQNDFKRRIYIHRLRVQRYWTRTKINVPEK